MLGARAVGAGDDEDVVGEVGGADPGLLPVQHVAAVAVDALGLAGEVADVGARLRLGHRDRLDPALADPAEDLLLLLLGAEALVGAGDDQADAVAGDRDQAAHRLLEEDAGVDHAGRRRRRTPRRSRRRASRARRASRRSPGCGAPVAVGELLALLGRAALALGEVADRVWKSRCSSVSPLIGPAVIVLIVMPPPLRWPRPGLDGGLVDGDDGGAAEPDVVLEGDLGAVDLALVGGAAQLPGQLAALGEAGGAERVALGDQAARRVDDRAVAAVGRRLGLDQLVARGPPRRSRAPRR